MQCLVLQVQWSSLRPTHGQLPLMCVELATSPSGVSIVVCKDLLVVLWIIGSQITFNTSTIPGHTALPRTTTYQQVVVDRYTNLRERYICVCSRSSKWISSEWQYV